MKTTGLESGGAGAPGVLLRSEPNVSLEVLNAAPVIVLLLDPQGLIQHVNPFFEQLTGWRLDEIKGKEWFTTFLPIRDQDRIRALFKVATSETPTHGNINAIITRKGEERDIEWNDQIIRDSNGNITCLLAIGMDVTERKRAERREAVRSRQLKELSELSLLLAGSTELVFEQIVRMIGEQFQVRVACVAQIEKDELRFRATYEKGEVCSEAGSCLLKMTPCATVQETKDLRIYDRVAERFPEASFLRTHNAYAYCGFPCLDKAGNVIAVIFVLDDKPRDFTEEEQHLLRIIGQRVATEIEHARVADEQKRAVQALRESERRTRQILNGLFGFVGVFSLDGTLIDANEAPLRMAGLSREEVLGRPFWDTYWWNYDERVQEELKSALMKAARGEVIRYEPNVRMQGGALITIDVTFGPLRNSAGEITDILGFAVDITDRKHAERAHRASEDRYQRVERGINDGLWEWNVITVEEYFSNYWLNMLGYEAGALPAHITTFTELVHPDDRVIVSKAVEGHLKENSRFDVEFRLRRKSGEYLWVRSRGIAERDAQGQPTLMSGSIRDISDRKQAEEALHQERDRLRQILDAEFGFVCVLTLDGVVVEINQTPLDLLNLSREEVLGRRLLDINWIAPESEQCVQSAIEAAARGDTVREDVVGRFRNVGRRDVDVIFSPLRDSNGCVINVIGYGVDITERKLIESEFISSTKRLNEAQRIANIGSWELDLTTSQLTWSDEIYRIFEIDPDRFEASYEAFLYAIHPEDREMVNAAYTQSLKTREPYDIVHRLQMADGRIKFVRERCETFYDDDKRPLRSLGTVQDVTQLQEAEDKLRASETRYRMLVEHATDGIFLHRSDGSVLDVNRQACESLGFSLEELIGMKVAEFDPFITPEALHEIQIQVEHGQAVMFESYHRRKDGSKFPVEIRINPFHIANEPVALAVVRDITERKQADVQLQELRDVLAHMNRLGTLGEIASGLAHELNQPLGAINIDASTSLFLSKEIDSPKLQSCLQRISDQALRAGEIVRRMRSFIRRDSSKKEPHEINRLVREVLMLLDDRLRHNSVKLELSLAESLPAIAVDGIQIQQVLVNLVRNADDAMAENGDVPRVLTIRTEAATSAIRIEIADTGCGLDPEIAAKLFFPFQTTKPSGLGLGLVICHTIVDAHDGRIEGRSNSVRGTTFTLTLPVIS